MIRRVSMIACILAGGLSVVGPVALGRSTHAAALPPIDGVAFAPALNASLPTDARFVDEDGRSVRLGDYLTERPAIVVPAYYGCANLCGIVLRSLAAGIASSRLRAGRDVEVIVVSISPLDRPSDALAKKREIVRSGDPLRDGGWHFLTGDATAIVRVADALGYRYAVDRTENQYAHASGLAVVDRQGEVTRTLYGAAFAPRDLEVAVASASTPSANREDRAAGARTWLLCFRYDPHTGRYSLAAMEGVRVAGLLALIVLGTYVANAARRERRGRRRARDER